MILQVCNFACVFQYPIEIGLITFVCNQLLTYTFSAPFPWLLLCKMDLVMKHDCICRRE